MINRNPFGPYIIDELILHWLRKCSLVTYYCLSHLAEGKGRWMWLTSFFKGQLASLSSAEHTKQMFQKHGQSIAFELSVTRGFRLMLAPLVEPVILPSLSKYLSQHLASDIMIYPPLSLCIYPSFSSPLECQLFRSQDCVLFSFCFHSTWYSLWKWVGSINVC